MSEKITVTYEIPAPPEGWVYDRVRRANAKGELYYLDGDWNKWEMSGETGGIYPVAVRKQQWRPATEADIGRTDARFSDYSKRLWIPGKLIHVFNRSDFPFAVVPDHNPDMFGRYEQCEVPTEPTK